MHSEEPVHGEFKKKFKYEEYCQGRRDSEGVLGEMMNGSQ